jgi:hypothetical protein
MHWRRTLPRAGALVAALALVAAAAARSPDAQASVSIAVGWTELLSGSTAAAVVTPEDARAVWENGRIYTYTQVHVDRAIAGDVAAGGVVWIRTRGGVVDHVGQLVEGEAVFVRRPSLVFLHSTTPGTYGVTARAQGQFPIVASGPAVPAHLATSRAVGAIVPRALPTPALPPSLATEVLDGQTVDDAARAIAAAWSTAHAR